MDQINPFTNAPSNAAPGAPQPVKPEPPKPKNTFSIKPLLKGAVMLIIGVVIAKLAFDSVFKQQPKIQQPPAQPARSTIKTTGQKAPAAAKTKSGKNKNEPELSLSETFAAAKKATKPVQQSGEPYVLNGIFLSETDDASSAIVNNKVVQVGDSVDGAKVISITIEGVELIKEGASTIKIRNK
jgi:hypothetical protein